MHFPCPCSVKTWVEANKTCEEDGASLVSIHSEPENAFLFALVQRGKVADVWTGLHDPKVGSKLLLILDLHFCNADHFMSINCHCQTRCCLDVDFRSLKGRL